MRIREEQGEHDPSRLAVGATIEEGSMRSCLFNRARCLGVLPVLLCLSSVGRADSLPAPSTVTANPPLTLQACRQIALGQQPALAATRSTLKAALDRQSAVENLRVPTCLARDLPIRRKQAALGLTIAQGGITQAESETLHGVTFSYLAALHAAQSAKLANGPIRGRLKDLQTLVSDPVTQKSRRDVVLPQHRNLVKSFLETLDGRIQEAEQGQQRALAALREAMGVGPHFVLTLPDRDLPCPRALPQLNELVALALARRGEMIQAATFADVVCLEIDAQAANNHRRNMRTFASGSDIHAKPIPSGDSGGVNYRPVIVGPEMPPFLTGSRDDRVRQAQDYHQRALAVVAKTRNLIALEVEDLYRRWLDKKEKAEHLRTAYVEARTFATKLKESFNKQMPGTYPNIDEIINSGLIETRLQLEWKEAHYQALQALAALERATAGGFQVDFDTAPACEPEAKEPAGETNENP
jgi:outer membrane protein TolC